MEISRNHLDKDLALELTSNNKELAQELLDMLLEHLPGHEKNIQLHFENNDLEKLCVEVHRLHGAACYCGVPLLKKTAKNLELTLKLEQEGNVTDLYQTLMKEITAVTDAAENFYF